MEISEPGYPLDEAIKALNALRSAASLPNEQFPLQAFVGMISDEIDELRNRGYSDEQIAEVIEANSAIKITAEQIAENYVTAEDRNRPAH